MADKRGISSIVATSLLLAMAVVSILTFQVWFNSFSSLSLIQVERDSTLLYEQFSINVISNSNLLIQSPLEFESVRIEINGELCTDTLPFREGINQFNILDCFEFIDAGVIEVLIITDDRVILRYVNLKNPVSIFNCDPLCSVEVLQVNNLQWTRTIDGRGIQRWALNDLFPMPSWDQNLGEYTWPPGRAPTDYPAFNVCNELILDGFNDWRLPTLEEFLALGNTIGWSVESFQNFGFRNTLFTTWLQNEVPPQGTTVVTYTGDQHVILKTNFAPSTCVRQV